MKLTYCLLVTNPISRRSGIVGLLRFVEALVERGHRVTSIFFYREGVRSTRYLSTVVDEEDLVLSWNRLVEGNGIRLFVCTQAVRRRMMGAEDLIPASFGGGMARFESGGVHQMARMIMDCDRCVSL